MSTDGAEQARPAVDAIDHRGRRRVPPKWVWVVVAVIGLVAAVVQGTEVLRDHALANIVTCALALFAVAILAAWFLLLSGFSWRLRLLVLAVCLAGVSVFVALFRIERFSGEMLPAFAYRFAAKPDWLLQSSLPQRAAGKAKAKVDLRRATPYDFPQFLGPDRSNSIDHVRLARDWTERPPKCVWRQAIGAAWSAFAAVNWHAVTMEQRGKWEMVTCYHIQTGQLEWAHATAVRYEHLQGGVGPRSTPTISDGRVYAIGAFGHLVCLDGETGKCLWEKDLLREYGITSDDEAALVPWGRAGSPLVVGERLIVPVGGGKDGRLVSLAAFDKRSGTRIWEGGQRQISYSSPALLTLAGAQQIVIANEDTLSGHDLQTGKLLWEHPWPGRTNSTPNICQPMPIAPNRVFVSKGYGQGAMLLQLEASAGGTFATQARLVQSQADEDQVLQPGYARRLRLRPLGRHPGMRRSGRRLEQVEGRPLWAWGGPAWATCCWCSPRRARSCWSKPRRIAPITFSAVSRPSRGCLGTTWPFTVRTCWCETPRKPPATSCRWKGGVDRWLAGRKDV